MNFRTLRADEVECRVGTAKEGKGVSLLLYKTARVDQDILDETVGCMNWQKRYSRDNANCEVGIWDAQKNQWIWKEDTGTESNTEKEKGLASDSFKRACFNWGIGRELYTAPFIWIQGATKYDRFWVKEMDVEDRKITRLIICCHDQYGNRIDDIAYAFPKGAGQAKKQKAAKSAPKEEQPLTDEQRAALAYPSRDDMVEAMLQKVPYNVIEKFIAGFNRPNVQTLTDVPDVGIQTMYGYFERKGYFNELS